MKWDDKANQWRRDLGYKATKSGAIGQHRFRFGADQKSAQLAEHRLVAFWQALEAMFKAERKGIVSNANASPTVRCLWEDWSLQIANEIKDGKTNVVPPAPPGCLFDCLGLADQETASLWLDMLNQYFGSIVGFQGAPVADGYQGQGVFAKPQPKTGQTFFHAIDAYITHLHLKHTDANGITNQSGVKTAEQAKRLKSHHLDCPLSTVDARAIEAMLRHWSKRPIDAKGKRYAKSTCKNQMVLIRAMLRWFHRSDTVAFRLPTDFLFPQFKMEWLQKEMSAIGNTKRTYTVAEIGILWQHATPLVRSFMALALNCSFGEGEISTLAEEEIHDKVIRRVRHKTKVFGCWWMFPITREAVVYVRGLKNVNGFSSPFLMVTTSCKTYDAVTKGNNKSGKIRNAWNRLTAKIRAIPEHKDFPKLSFGKLRKTSSSWVRKIGGGELASIHISHGNATGDKLLDVYANRDFKRLFRVHKRIWAKLSKVLVGSFPAPKASKPHYNPVEPAKQKRILALRQQGFKVAHIAKEIGTTTFTVRRILAKAKKEEAVTT